MSCQQFHMKKYLSLWSITIHVKHNGSKTEISLRRNTGSKLHKQGSQTMLFSNFFWIHVEKNNLFPTKIYLFKVDNRNTRKRCKMLFKVNNENTRTTSVSIIDFELVNVSWVEILCNNKQQTSSCRIIVLSQQKQITQS